MPVTSVWGLSCPTEWGRTGSEQLYYGVRKEFLAVIWVLKHFKCHLYGQKIIVRMNNSTVRWVHQSKDSVGQLAHCIEVIDTYDIIFHHRPGPKERKGRRSLSVPLWRQTPGHDRVRGPCCNTKPRIQAGMSWPRNKQMT